MPPPRRFRQLGLAAATSAITVTYYGFPAEAQAAFEYAVSIFENQFVSSVPMTIYAAWDNTLGYSTLGQNSHYIVAGYSGLMTGTWYAKTLAGTLHGSQILPGTDDMDIRINSNKSTSFYYGIDGVPTTGKYDLVTIVLHEIAHGLGYSGSMTVDGSGRGSWGFWPESGMSPWYPDIYDRFTENGSGTDLISYVNGSTELAAQLQGGSLYWNGANGMSANGGQRPQLYAPASWSSGSSYSHLDEAVYLSGNVHSLMTPQLGMSEVIHDLGAISRGMFKDEGWTISTSCGYAVSPTSASIAYTGSVGSVYVGTTSGCAWTATSNATSWLTVTGGASGTGSGYVNYSVAVNTGRVRTGTLTVAGTTVTITQASSMPTLTPSPSTLRYGAVNTGGGTLSVLTPSQQVTLSQSDSGTVAWTATANQPWLTVTSGTGTGAGKFTVTLANYSGLPTSGTVTGTITVSAPNAGSDPTIPVYLRLYSSTGATAAPNTYFDTPVNGSTVTGAINVTGWAVDDVGISSVKIYRNCIVGLDLPASCATVGGRNLVYIGPAAFLAGARPDVEALFPTYPLAYKAGWGMQVLTNMLPHVTAPANRAGGGQGTMSLYAHIRDLDGHAALLGPKTILANNDNGTVPFGTIDTPALDSTVSGTLYNYGWALTPLPAIIATDGSTMNVVIDDVGVGKVAYNQCRAGSTNVPPVGTCADDIATLFPTRRNITEGSGAIGAYVIDTTALSNGQHTLAWGVIDSLNRNDGLGSRFFTVLNGGSSLTPAERAAAIAKLREAPAKVLGQASEIAWRAVSPGEVYGRSGFNFDAPFELIWPDSEGVRHVAIPEIGHLRLSLGDGVTTGYLQANGTLRALPPGSRVDPATGVFGWTPGPGYIGTYDLVFLQGAARIPIRVTLRPKTAATAGRMRSAVDLPSANATVSGAFTVAGWALDLDAWQGSGVGAVHVWAWRRDMPAASPVFLGEAALGGVRPDVARQFGAQFDRGGWGLTASGLDPGTYDITAYFWSTRTGRFEDARTIRVTVR